MGGATGSGMGRLIANRNPEEMERISRYPDASETAKISAVNETGWRKATNSSPLLGWFNLGVWYGGIYPMGNAGGSSGSITRVKIANCTAENH